MQAKFWSQILQGKDQLGTFGDVGVYRRMAVKFASKSGGRGLDSELDVKTR
jgi:hypothetical protein